MGAKDMSHLVTPEMIQTAHRSGYRNHVVVETEYTIKIGLPSRVTSNEYRVLQMLERLDVAPTPRPLAFFTVPIIAKRSPVDTTEHLNVLIMSTLPGKLFGAQHYKMSVEAKRHVLAEVRAYMAAIDRAIISDAVASQPPLAGPAAAPRSALSDFGGHQCMRFPFVDERSVDAPVAAADFEATMHAATPQTAEHEPLQREVLDAIAPSRDASDITFCHMDLHGHNFLVENGAVSGIIDWERAGWYTTTLEAFTALTKCVYPRDMFADYVAAWDIPERVAAAALTAHDPLRHAHQRREHELRMARQLAEGIPTFRVRRRLKDAKRQGGVAQRATGDTALGDAGRA